MKKPLVVIVGPTAVGKTDLSIKLAQNLNSEIISADSMLVYRGMDIGTAKPTQDEMRGIKHHLIDVVEPSENFSTAEYKDLVKQSIDDILERSKLPMIAGGTGLYVNSLLNNYDFTPTTNDSSYREGLKQLASEKGNEYVHSMLEEIDYPSFVRIHSNDLRRTVRALEVYHFTGKTITYYQEESKKVPSEYNLAMIGLTIDRSLLYNRIELRVDKMIENGLIEEVAKLKDLGCNESNTSMQGLGYKEILKYLNGECSLEEAIYELKLETRHFAKRQLSWFRRDERIKWFEIDKYSCLEILIKDIIEYIGTKLQY
jgi:tRNA dimethylallyltransferase